MSEKKGFDPLHRQLACSQMAEGLRWGISPATRLTLAAGRSRALSAGRRSLL
jgi:hypothetical protein